MSSFTQNHYFVHRTKISCPVRVCSWAVRKTIADLHKEGVAIVDGVSQLERKHCISTTATKLRPIDIKSSNIMESPLSLGTVLHIVIVYAFMASKRGGQLNFIHMYNYSYTFYCL